jgi:hypothetical protein
MRRVIKHSRIVFPTILLVLFVISSWNCRNRQLTPDEHNRNFCEFVINPFRSEFKRTGNLKKNIIDKFGKPLSVEKFYGYLRENSNIRIDETRIHYNNYDFTICKTKYFKIIRNMFITDFSDVKYNINEEATMDDIEALFGERTESRTDIYYKSIQCGRNKWRYLMDFHFKKNKLDGIYIEKRYDEYKYDD